MRPASVLVLSLSLLAVDCKKKEEAAAPPPAASSVASPVTGAGASPSASGKHRREDRHEGAVPAKLELAVSIGAEKRTWHAADFAKVPTSKGTANDGEDRETWSLREIAHTLVGPSARVVAVVGDKRVAIDAAAWSDPKRIPVLHTTRRGALKFRYTDAAQVWGESEVSDVTGLEIAP